MSAICGAWVYGEESDPARLCGTMLDALAAHGADGCSQIDLPGLSAGRRLLRITPEDIRDEQPIHVAGQVTFVGDVRLDNRDELGGELRLDAAELANLADAALLARAWVRWGQSCLDHLCGAFAFAAWEHRTEQLFLARDHAGERPLYFRHTGGCLLFATTARALRACPGVSSELDESQLVRDLVGLPAEYPRTRFVELRQLAPGHSLLVDRERATYRRYWDIHRLRPTRFARDEDYASRFRELFDQAVGARLRTTGGVASELSAGLDSGSVTAAAAQMVGASGRNLTAYTSVPSPGFSGPTPRGCLTDEGPAAAEVARLYPNIRHVLVNSTGSDMLCELARLYPLLDLPEGAPLNAVWSNLIQDDAKAAGVRVILTGALGNFAASYTGTDILHALFVRGRLVAGCRTAWQMRRMGISSGRNAASLTVFSALPWALRRRLDPLVRGTGIDWSAVSPAAAGRYAALDQFRRFLFVHRSQLPRLLDTQFLSNQYGDYNAAVSAGWQIEVRDPTADRRLIEFCASVPPEQFLAGGMGRSLIRRAMKDRLPASTLSRIERGAQSADWYESLSPIRGRLAEELEAIARSPVARRLLDIDRLRRAIAEWPETARDARAAAVLYQSTIPRGISVGYFIRRAGTEHDPSAACEGSSAQS